MKLLAGALSLFLLIPSSIIAEENSTKQVSSDPTEEMILPVVRLFVNEQIIGTAFLLLHNGKPHVLTARHCVFEEEEYKILKIEQPNLTREQFAAQAKPKIEIVRGSVRQVLNLKPFYIDDEFDFALLEVCEPKDKFLPGDQKFSLSIPLVFAKLASDETIKKIKAFDVCFVVGFPLGTPDAKVSMGVLFPERNGNLGSTAPITSGNSGSPIYDGKTHEVIGIVSYLYIDTRNGQFLTHINGSVPISRFRAAIATGKIK